MCVNRDDCNGCPFYITKCTFEEPKPSTWFDEESIAVQSEPVKEKPAVREPNIKGIPVEPEAAEAQAEPEVEAAPEPEVKEPVAQPQEAVPEVVPQNEEDDSAGTWLVSTTMGSVFTKYVFICSKCGYRKESIFSMPPISYCPECEKQKAGQA